MTFEEVDAAAKRLVCGNSDGGSTWSALDESQRNAFRKAVNTFEDDPPQSPIGVDPNPTDTLLGEREKTHGSFEENARIYCELCDVIGKGHKFNKSQRLAIGMIFMKIARATQNPNVKDHWLDIAGYATLASKACTK